MSGLVFPSSLFEIEFNKTDLFKKIDLFSENSNK